MLSHHPSKLAIHTHTNQRLLVEIRRSKSLNDRRPLREPSSEDTICILKHAVLQTDNNELGALEAILDKPSDILRMREIQSRIHLVQNIHGCGLKLQQRHDERDGDERPLAAGKFR